MSKHHECGQKWKKNHEHERVCLKRSAQNKCMRLRSRRDIACMTSSPTNKKTQPISHAFMIHHSAVFFIFTQLATQRHRTTRQPNELIVLRDICIESFTLLDRLRMLCTHVAPFVLDLFLAFAVAPSPLPLYLSLFLPLVSLVQAYYSLLSSLFSSFSLPLDLSSFS